ncbi:MAG: PDR/VanB family oxidoreductase [Steroidobacteraceae bacterium]
MSISTDMPMRVAEITQVADRVKRFRLERRDGGTLPYFSGGAHVVVTMRDAGGLRRNAYSLMSAPHESSAYAISVLHVEKSRGGSQFMHEQVDLGTELTVSQPVNLFPVDQRGRRHLFLAGGIGITPFMAMLEQLERGGQDFELHYAIRGRSHGAYWRELQGKFGGRVNVYCDAEKVFIPVAKLLDDQPLGTHLYVCGPTGMIDATLTMARHAGWPQQNLHFERFLGPPAGNAFRVILQRSGMDVAVEGRQSILEAVEAAGVDAPFLCRGGACGQCATAVLGLDGALEHNDHYLSDAEKVSNSKLMICVSRFKGRALVLDL